MKLQFILYRRNGTYYCEDTVSGKQQSLHTKDKGEAKTLLNAKNEAHRQPILNRQIALAYLSATDPEAAKRTWQFPMDEMTALKSGETRVRCLRAMQSTSLDPLRNRPILETRAEHFLQVLRGSNVSTNVFLRRLHNFALDMSWLPKPVLPKKQWPKPVYKEKRAITLEEHEAIVARERNAERRAFYQLAWHLGAAQTDIALLKAEDIDWDERIISFFRKKTRSVARMHFGAELETILRTLPATGQLFPYLCRVRAADRATEFRQRCAGLDITGVTLHSYRYAWAERAKTAGYPERFAQEALGHNSKAVHRTYARKAQVLLPTLEDYEKKIIPLRPPNGETAAINSSVATA